MKTKGEGLKECGFCWHLKELHNPKGKRECLFVDCNCKEFLTKVGFEDSTFRPSRGFGENLLLFIALLMIFSLIIGSIGGLVYLIKLIF